jgi:quinol monooxygenase YgiN
MITRIVRMEFEPAKVQEFLTLFTDTSSFIRTFPGVNRLELHRDLEKENVFYTMSEWESEADLEVYRHSKLFESVWSRTKILFSGKPQAFSLVKRMDVQAKS